MNNGYWLHVTEIHGTIRVDAMGRDDSTRYEIKRDPVWIEFPPDAHLKDERLWECAA